MQAHTIIRASDAVGSWAWLSAGLLPSPASPESKDVSPTILAKTRPSIVAVNFVSFIASESWCQSATEKDGGSLREARTIALVMERADEALRPIKTECLLRHYSCTVGPGAGDGGGVGAGAGTRRHFSAPPPSGCTRRVPSLPNRHCSLRW
jgi:hypothetical protein